MTRFLVSAVVFVSLLTGGVVVAQPGIRASAERAAAELVQSSRVEMRRSSARVGIGLAVAAAGAVMLLIEPKQPTQPGVISRDALINETAGLLSDTDFFAEQIVEVDPAAVAVFCRYRPACAIYVKGTIDGAVVGAATALAVATRDGRTVYGGPIQPFKERSPGLKYGGAALAIAGAALAAFWSDVPVARDMAISPTRGGLRLGSRITF